MAKKDDGWRSVGLCVFTDTMFGMLMPRLTQLEVTACGQPSLTLQRWTEMTRPATHGIDAGDVAMRYFMVYQGPAMAGQLQRGALHQARAATADEIAADHPRQPAA